MTYRRKTTRRQGISCPPIAFARPCGLATAIACALFCLAALGAERVETTFEEHGDLVINPDCGWVAYNYEDSYDLRRRVAGGAPFDLASVMYTRHPSRAWQDDKGAYADSAPLRLLEDWMASKRHVAFRIYANRPGDMPASLATEVETFEYRAGGATRRGIKYWDAAYVEGHRRLVDYLGERLAGSPYLAYVDIGGVGDTGGEWCFSHHEAYRHAGLDDDTFYALAREFIDMYRRAFPETRLFISYECVAKAGSRRADVMELLDTRDIGVRDDGLGGWPYPRMNPPLSSWPMPVFWRKTPVLFEGGGSGGGVYGWEKRQGKSAASILEWAFRKCRPSYINIGGAESNSEKACSELRELLLRYGRRLGYRFALLKASLPATLEAGRPASIVMTWANRGVAPCYADRPLEISLASVDGDLEVRLLAEPTPSTRQWAPGEETEARATFTLPADLPPGRYALKTRLVLSGDTDERFAVNIATKGADAEGRHSLGEARVEK